MFVSKNHLAYLEEQASSVPGLQRQINDLKRRFEDEMTKMHLQMGLLVENIGREFYMTEEVPERVIPAEPARLAIRKKRSAS